MFHVDVHFLIVNVEHGSYLLLLSFSMRLFFEWFSCNECNGFFSFFLLFFSFKFSMRQMGNTINNLFGCCALTKHDDNPLNMVWYVACMKIIFCFRIRYSFEKKFKGKKTTTEDYKLFFKTVSSSLHRRL